MLATAGAATAALAGAASGAAWSAAGGPASSTTAAAAAVSTAALLDLVAARVGWAPLSVRRQVPRAWGRLFSPETAAVLYGSRLGVGPLTVLNTWQWWAAAGLAASRGPVAGATVGIVFHVSRVGAMEGLAAGRPDMVERMRRVDRLAGPVAVGGSVAVVALATVLAVVTTDPGTERASSQRVAETSVPTAASVATTSPSTADGPADPTGLGALLISSVGSGWDRDDAVVGAGPLDLEAAAALEPDVAAERGLLQTRGFVAGHSRAFVNDGDGVVYVQLYRLASAEQAAFYLADGRETVLARGAVEFPVDVPAGALGFTQVEDASDGAFVANAVSFTVDDLHVLVVAGSTDGSTTAELARDVAAEQAARLAPT